MSAIGPAVEAFGKYARVEKLSGEEVTVGELLEYVRKVVGEFALKRILEEGELGGWTSLPASTSSGASPTTTPGSSLTRRGSSPRA